MKIEVRNNNPLKAYKLLMKKLGQDGFYAEIRKQRHYTSKSENRRLAKKAAIARENKRRKEKEQHLIKADSLAYRRKKPNNRRR